MENYFLSKRNYTLLYEIVKTGLYKRWNYDISTDRENGFLEKMRTIMRQIYNDRKKFNIDETAPTAEVVKSLNKYTLDFIIPHFGEIIQYTITVSKPRNELPPQSTLHRNLQTDFGSNVAHRPIAERSTSTRTVEKTSVMENYQLLNNERDSALKPHVPKPIDFTLPTGDKSDPSDRYIKMQSQRDAEIERFKHVRDATNTKDFVNNTMPPPSIKQEVKITQSGIEGYTNMKSQNLAQSNFDDMTEQKLRMDRSIENSFEELVAQRNDLVADINTVKASGFGTVTNTETFMGGKSLLDDRNDGVFLAGDSSTVNPNILFEEDKGIKAELEARMKRPEIPRGIAFKPPVETEFRTHYITVDSRDRDCGYSANTSSHYLVKFPYIRLKNVREIKLLSAILPNEATIKNEPYILLSIPEIDGPMYSSNNRNIKIFNKLYNNKNTFNTSLDYLNYMPDPVKKVYPINALGSIEQLTIHLMKYDGTTIDMSTTTPVNDYTSFTFEIVQSVADTSNLQSDMI